MRHLMSPLDLSVEELEHLLEEFSFVRPRIVGIGVGICGTIRKTEGRSLHITRIRGWEHVELQRILQEKFHLPVYVKGVNGKGDKTDHQ